jgi:hypothetical protein
LHSFSSISMELRGQWELSFSPLCVCLFFFIIFVLFSLFFFPIYREFKCWGEVLCSSLSLFLILFLRPLLFARIGHPFVCL